MKKLLFIAAFAMVFSNNINAQETTSVQTTTTSESGISFGAKAGVNFASISNLDEGSGESVKGRTSFHVGALAQYSFNEKFAAQVELLYSGLGINYEYSDNYNNTEEERAGGGNYRTESTFKLTYLTMPVLAKYFVIEGLSLEVGPQFSFLLSAKEDWEESHTGGSDSSTEDFKDYVKGVDIGAAIGASYELDFGLFFSARYVLGLSKMSEKNNGYYYFDEKSKNNVFQLSAGYKFN